MKSQMVILYDFLTLLYTVSLTLSLSSDLTCKLSYDWSYAVDSFWVVFSTSSIYECCLLEFLELFKKMSLNFGELERTGVKPS